MKKKFMFLFVVVLVVSMLPISVFAAEPAELDVRVYNRTGAPVDLSLTDADGVKTFFTLPADESVLTLTEGVYEYYAMTPCGPEVGRWNVNVVKELRLRCADAETPEIKFAKTCPNNWWGKMYIEINDAGHPIGWYFDRWDNLTPPDAFGGDWIEGEVFCASDLFDDHMNFPWKP